MVFRALIVLGITFAVAAPAAAQERTPQLRQTLVDLAYALGESHALRQACQGEGDQFWRMRMLDMMGAEMPDSGLDARMRDAFNTGYAGRKAEHPTCGLASRRAEVAAAERGRALAGRLAEVAYKVEGSDPYALPEDEMEDGETGAEDGAGEAARRPALRPVAPAPQPR